MTAEEFANAYDYVFNNTSSGTYAIDKIFSKYDPDGNLTIQEVFNELSEYDRQKVIEFVQANMPKKEFSDVGYAEEMYKKALNYELAENAAYCNGIVDFYEALKAEGIDIGF